MKKWIIKFFEWDRSPQLLCLIAAGICLIVWIRGNEYGAFFSGFILGLAYGWEFYIHTKRERDAWENRAFNILTEKEKLFSHYKEN